MSSASTLARADRACAQLRRDGKPVTFTAVAAITGLGRTTLYRNPALRAIIDDHRRRAGRSGTLAGITDEIALLHTALDALAERVGRHEEQIRKLAHNS
jgi:Family of unknown function (DUF6262)